MTTTEHLNLILAHLDKLLATAEKRTPGEWEWTDANLSGEPQITSDGNALVCTVHHECVKPVKELDANATFIASCAGNAEAGWRATKAAILGWKSLFEATDPYADGAPDATVHDKLCNEVSSICRIKIQHILSAFPLELITTNNP